MQPIDFEYDGILLSEMGFILCSFNGGRLETVTNGLTITFNTVPMNNGQIFHLTSTQYQEVLTATFQICKNPCNVSDNSDMYFSYDDIRALSRWLGRKEYKKFRLLNRGEEFDRLYYEGSFNISNIKHGDNVVGMELELTTNRPYALTNTVKQRKTLDANQIWKVNDLSDEMGSNNVRMKITMKDKGNFILYNYFNDDNVDENTIKIPNVITNEVIKLDSPLVSTNDPKHDLLDIDGSFNFNFPKLYNTYNNTNTYFKPNLPCIIEIEYEPSVKVGL